MMACTQETIKAAVWRADLGNSLLCIHSSLRSFGHVEGGAPAVVAAMLDAGCTLLVPTHSWVYALPPPMEQRLQRNGWGDYDGYIGPQEGMGQIYTPSSMQIDADMGAIPAAIVAMPGRVRGWNPIASFSAVGPNAEDLIAGQTAEDVSVPLRRLAELEGRIVLMGVDLTSMTALHLAEEMARRTPFRRWANGVDGKPMPVAVGGCSDGFVHFDSVLAELEMQIKVCDSQWRIYPAGDLLEKATQTIRAQPTITHCGQPDCERCADAIAGGPLLL